MSTKSAEKAPARARKGKLVTAAELEAEEANLKPELEEEEGSTASAAPRPARARAPSRAKPQRARIALPPEVVDAAAEVPLQLAGGLSTIATIRRAAGPVNIYPLMNPQLKDVTKGVVRQAVGLIEVPIGWALVICYLSTISSGILAAVMTSQLQNVMNDPAKMEMLGKLMGQMFPGAAQAAQAAAAQENANGASRAGAPGAGPAGSPPASPPTA